LLMELEARGSGTLDQRTVTVCSGLDLVNITYNNFVATDEKSAAVRVSVCCRRICSYLFLQLSLSSVVTVFKNFHWLLFYLFYVILRFKFFIFQCLTFY